MLAPDDVPQAEGEPGDRALPLRPTRAWARVNSELQPGEDQAVAKREHAQLAAVGEHACVTWVDSRSGEPRVRLRRVEPQALGREVSLPAGPQEASSGFISSLTLDSDGSCLVGWIGAGPAGARLYVQAFDRDLNARGAAIPLDPDHRASPLFPPALATLSARRGYAVAWVRDSRTQDSDATSVWVQRLSRKGEPLGAPRRIESSTLLQNPALARLDDGRLILAWDKTLPDGQGRRLRGRLLDERLVPVGRKIYFIAMFTACDWDPALAPGPDGGFVMAWCAGADRNRDVFARSFDAEGRPNGRPLALSTRTGSQSQPCITRLQDGSHVVAWSDDLAGSDEVRMRRINPRDGPGPTIQPAPEAFAGAALGAAPSLAAFGESLLLAGTHDAGGVGPEVGLCLLPAHFQFSVGR